MPCKWNCDLLSLLVSIYLLSIFSSSLSHLSSCCLNVCVVLLSFCYSNYSAAGVLSYSNILLRVYDVYGRRDSRVLCTSMRHHFCTVHTWCVCRHFRWRLLCDLLCVLYKRQRKGLWRLTLRENSACLHVARQTACINFMAGWHYSSCMCVWFL